LSEDVDVLTLDAIGGMSFRELQHACRENGLSPEGTTGALRARIRQVICPVDPFTGEEDCPVPEETPDELMKGIEFVDESDQDFDFKELLSEVMKKSSVGHWKAATRKLKKLKRRFPTHKVPEEAYVNTLQACSADRLHGARASEPARKIMEELIDEGYEIPADLGNYCIQNCLGFGQNGTHDGCGGIDTALAMLAAMESSPRSASLLTVDTYGKLAVAMAKNGEIDDSMALLRSMVVDKSFTPTLEIFAEVAHAIPLSEAEKVLNVLAYAKAAGYELDNIASTKDGQTILASGVIAAEKLDNLALGLRLLAAASKASGCAPDRGDVLVASHSSAAQRAATILHKRALNGAVNEGQWKLAVRLLDTMMQRSLTPSPWVWRNVVTCCAKAEKSRKATSLLLDWVKLAESGKMEKPSVSVFNTVINACEICDEQELTLGVLEAMKKTHNTEGNLITFNIALKRLAKLGNPIGCEGIIIGMLQNGVEPSVVSYTTTIAACAASEPKNPALAYEWLKRMRSRRVMPNVITYNTALASCLDGKMESTALGSKIATEMMEDVSRQVVEGTVKEDELILPDEYSKGLARKLMKQLRENWRNGDIDMQVAKATVRVPLLKLVDFQKSEAVQALKKRAEEVQAVKQKAEDEADATIQNEVELEYSATEIARRAAEV
jgi:hypothetical protein